MIRTAKRIERVDEYYFSRKLAEVRSLDTPERKVINLGIGSPDLAPTANVIDALMDSARLPNTHGYQSYKGTAALRQAIASFYLNTYRVSLDAERAILPLMGSKEGIMHISMAFVDEGDEVLVPDPGYPTYSSVANLVGAKIRTYTMDEEKDWAPDIEALQQQDLSRVKLMWTNFPHMPTGRVAQASELHQLVDLAREHRFLIVNDNPYSLILNESPLSILSIPGADEVALELNSLSKSHNMAGWRIGWVAGRPEFLDAILRVKSNMDSGMFLGLQQAATEALRHSSTWFNQLNDVYRERRKVAHEILDSLDCRYTRNQSGLFVWARVSDRIADVEKWVDEILYGARVFITPGFIFGSKGARHVRVSLCSPAEQMKQALERIHQHQANSSDKIKVNVR
ncbi:MAG: pyridoxal phosphate-dependent aminotransferase [Cyclobacteriaceae bacterium]|jgi:LL-diaminopimelate aminotransferase